jgi:hypothetical protein
MNRFARDLGIGVLSGVLSIPAYTIITHGLHSLPGFSADTWHQAQAVWSWAVHDRSPRDGLIAMLIPLGVTLIGTVISMACERQDRAAAKYRQERRAHDNGYGFPEGWSANDGPASNRGPGPSRQGRIGTTERRNSGWA